MLFLLGFMGSGKSYWGRRLADHLGWALTDLDAAIEVGEGATVADLFAERGEAAFRELERHYLHQLADADSHTVVSTGGGTPCFFDNLQWMQQHGRTVYLATSVPVLAERLWSERTHRPLLANVSALDFQDFIEKRLEARRVWYEQADEILHAESTTGDVFLGHLTACARLSVGSDSV